jgi:multidrug efflux pump subunit AcrA (membrane-fusion protein)
MAVKNNSLRKMWFVSGGLILAVLVSAGLVLLHKGSLADLSGDDETATSLRILTVPVESIEMSKSYQIDWSFVGRVEASRSSDLGFEFGGLVALLAVDEGDRVKKGAVLAELNTERLSARRAELAASLKEAQASLALSDNTRRRTREAFDLNAVSGRAVELAKTLYESGLADFLTVLDAEGRLTAVEDRLVISETTIVTRLIQVYKALGGGWEVYG